MMMMVMLILPSHKKESFFQYLTSIRLRFDNLFQNGGQGMMGQRSHSAAPTDSPSLHSRSRSKSPRRMGDHRSLSPPEGRIHLHGQPIPSHAYVPRFSRSATATPTDSPKKRQLPQIPHALQKALKERVAQVFLILQFLTLWNCIFCCP